MALSIFDPATNLSMPMTPGIPIVGGGVGGGISALLNDRNFLSLLAVIGQNLDPKGAGGIIGGPTRALIASQAAQERADKQAAATNAQTRMVIEALNQHGGMTPKGAPGIDSIGSTPEGGVKLEITPHPDGLETPAAVAPTTPTTPETPQAAPVTTLTPPATPSAPAPVPGVVPGTGQTVPTTGGSIQTARDRRLALLPFYSRLLGAPQVPWQA